MNIRILPYIKFPLCSTFTNYLTSRDDSAQIDFLSFDGLINKNKSSRYGFTIKHQEVTLFEGGVWDVTGNVE